jgi:hypothetical protein
MGIGEDAIALTISSEVDSVRSTVERSDNAGNIYSIGAHMLCAHPKL